MIGARKAKRGFDLFHYPVPCCRLCGFLRSYLATLAMMSIDPHHHKPGSSFRSTSVVTVR